MSWQTLVSTPRLRLDHRRRYLLPTSHPVALSGYKLPLWGVLACLTSLATTPLRSLNLAPKNVYHLAYNVKLGNDPKVGHLLGVTGERNPRTGAQLKRYRYGTPACYSPRDRCLCFVCPVRHKRPHTCFLAGLAGVCRQRRTRASDVRTSRLGNRRRREGDVRHPGADASKTIDPTGQLGWGAADLLVPILYPSTQGTPRGTPPRPPLESHNGTKPR